MWWGGILIMIGNAMLAIGQPRLFFVGLIVIVSASGLLKPNISAIVAQLYPEGGSRRDAGFSIFYMGINLGAFFGSLLVPDRCAEFGWNVGFALPAIGMVFGLIQFRYTRKYLGGSGVVGGAGRRMAARAGRRSSSASCVLLAVIAAMAFTGALQLDPVAISQRPNWAMVAFAAGYFAYLLFFAGLELDERKRVVVMIALFVACAMFWAGFEQAGASFNLFAERHTDRNVFGWDMPAGALQTVNPLFIILFAPVFAAIWVKLGARNLDPVRAGEVRARPDPHGRRLLRDGARRRSTSCTGEKVLPTWLILTYLLHTFGELCLSPVGLSSMTKLAPARFVGQVMGVWFLATAIGNNLAGQFAGEIDLEQSAADAGSVPLHLLVGRDRGGVMLVLTPVLAQVPGGSALMNAADVYSRHAWRRCGRAAACLLAVLPASRNGRRKPPPKLDRRPQFVDAGQPRAGRRSAGKANAAGWTQQTYITVDTQFLNAQGQRALSRILQPHGRTRPKRFDAKQARSRHGALAGAAEARRAAAPAPTRSGQACRARGISPPSSKRCTARQVLPAGPTRTARRPPARTSTSSPKSSPRAATTTS